jgi:hypothetical protein
MRRFSCLILFIGCALGLALRADVRSAKAATSVSAWDAADFRIWGYIPYWATDTQITNFATNGMYTHVSDVLYFGGVKPKIDGTLYKPASQLTRLNTLKNQATANGFQLHMSMFEVNDSSSGDDVDLVWESIIADPAKRTTFVNNINTLLQDYNMKGFNFDWERPSNATEWGNYTQLARELGNVIRPQGKEVSVCDFGFADTSWDNTALFDAAVYDQLFIMGYHYTAAQNTSYANGHNNLTGQGSAKAFKDSQIAIGVGTWGAGVDPDGDGPQPKPSTVNLSTIVAANPNLAYDVGSYTGTLGSTTGTWNIESRKQVREKTQVALGRNMPGMFSWTLHYDATNNMGLHRVMHHYAVVKRDAPDLNLDGKIDATDATVLANNMGNTPLTNTGTTTAAQFDDFYLRGNWEKGDRDGNGFVNQSDADWLAGRYTALGVTLPDRLAYSGTFENFSSAIGVVGRWKAGRNAQNKLVETSNFTQHGSSFLSWSGTGVGASKRSSSFVTLRNQTSGEVAASENAQARTMQADLSTNIDLSQNQDAYVTFLMRENTASLSTNQLASINRSLSLDFLNSSGDVQFNFGFRGLQHHFGIDSMADALGQDVISAGGFASNSTYLFVGKISGNGSDANKMQASLFASGAVVPDFTNPEFQWMLNAQSGASFNPTITDLQFTSGADGNYTVSNVWIGNAAAIIPPTLTSQGDFNWDGIVDSRDYVVWRKAMGQTGPGMAADGNGNNQIDTGDYNVWRAHAGQSVTGSGSGLGAGAAVPEPSSLLLLLAGAFFALARRRR